MTDKTIGQAAYQGYATENEPPWDALHDFTRERLGKAGLAAVKFALAILKEKHGLELKPREPTNDMYVAILRQQTWDCDWRDMYDAAPALDIEALLKSPGLTERSNQRDSNNGVEPKSSLRE